MYKKSYRGQIYLPMNLVTWSTCSMALSETADELQSDGSAMCPVKIADELFEICL